MQHRAKKLHLSFGLVLVQTRKLAKDPTQADDRSTETNINQQKQKQIGTGGKNFNGGQLDGTEREQRIEPVGIAPTSASG